MPLVRFDTVLAAVGAVAAVCPAILRLRARAYVFRPVDAAELLRHRIVPRTHGVVVVVGVVEVAEVVEVPVVVAVTLVVAVVVAVGVVVAAAVVVVVVIVAVVVVAELLG